MAIADPTASSPKAAPQRRSALAEWRAKRTPSQRSLKLAARRARTTAANHDRFHKWLGLF